MGTSEISLVDTGGSDVRVDPRGSTAMKRPHRISTASSSSNPRQSVGDKPFKVKPIASGHAGHENRGPALAVIPSEMTAPEPAVPNLSEMSSDNSIKKKGPL